MLRRYYKRLILGFAGFIEPIQPSSNLTPTIGFHKTFYDNVSRCSSRTFDQILQTTASKYTPCIPLSRSHMIRQDSHKLLDQFRLQSYGLATSSSFNSLPDIKNKKRMLMNNDLEKKMPSIAFSTDVEKDKDVKNEPEEEDESNMTIFQRFKSTYKKHGKTLLAVHVTTSIVWFGGFYYVARSGIDVISWMEYYKFPPTVISPFKHAGLGDLAVMYLLYKVATPLRYTVTLGGTNLAIRYLKSTGYIEPVSPEDSLRGLMKDSKDKLKERQTELIEQSREKIQTMKDKRDADKNS